VVRKDEVQILGVSGSGIMRPEAPRAEPNNFRKIRP
jgi:hypothetical protein